MSMTSNRPADQPNHRRTARNVNRASSCPASTSRSTPVSFCTRVEHRRPVRCLAQRRRGKGHQVLAALVLGDHQGLAHGLDERVGAPSSMLPSSVTCSDRCSSVLCE